MTTPKCMTCIYGLTCNHRDAGEPNRWGCLDDGKYKHYVEGDPKIRLLKLQRSGEINIVIGGEGEHEVNANWSMEEAYKHLADTCEACGGLVVKEGVAQLLLMKTYGPSFVLEWMHGKLVRISIRERRVWWEAK